MSRSLAGPLAALAVGVAVVTALGIPAHATYGARVTADEPQYLLTALSIGRDGDLDIANQLAAEAYRPFHRVDLDPQTFPLDDAGRQISPHDPLLPAVLALPMRFGGWVAAKATLAVLAGVLAALTAWVTIRRFGVQRNRAVAVVALFACTAPLATYATQVYPEIPAALATTAGVAALTGSLRRRGLIVLLASVTALPWLSVKYMPVAAALGAVAAWQLRHRRPALITFAGAVSILGALYLAAHRVLYGGWTAYASGDYFATAGGESAVIGTDPNYVGRARRLVGLVVDDGFGLAAWMPAWLLLTVAIGVAVARRGGGERAALLAPLAAGWLTATFVALTMHGWWWPGRQLIVVLPVAVIAIAIAAEFRWVRLALVPLGAAGVITWGWTTIEAIARRHTLIVDFDQTANPFVRAWRLVLPDGRTPTTVDEVLLALWAFALVWSGWRAWHLSRTYRHI